MTKTFKSLREEQVKMLNGIVVGSISRTHRGYKYVHHNTGETGKAPNKQEAIFSVRERHNSWLESGK